MSKISKARQASECEVLEQIPNVGTSIAQDLRLVGVHHPRDLKKREAFSLYQALNKATGIRHDPCVLDVFMAAVDFMNGAPAASWWHYTAQRKAQFGDALGG